MSRPLQVEPLEDRTAPAVTRLIVDFNLDAGQRPVGFGFNHRTFADAFSNANSLGIAPRFLDFNRDGILDVADVRLAAEAILNRVREYFLPFAHQRVSVEGADLEGNTNAGRRLLRRGVASPNLQVFVIYLGGSLPDLRVFGRAPQAAIGANFEGFGQVYSDAVTEVFLALGRGEGSPQRWAEIVASSVAHEFGHLLGLGHPVDLSQDQDSVMNSNRPRIGREDAFINRPYLAFLFAPTGRARVVVAAQNPFLELLRSFRGQRHERLLNVQQEYHDLLFASGRVLDGIG